MQEAYLNGYWDEIVNFTRNLFNAAFKTNQYLARAIMTGITRVSKESIFSDLNNLKVVASASNEYADVFGFTEEEVFAGMDEQGLDDREEVKRWYDGFTFGKAKDIYNPWSILNYLDTGRIGIYWANTSSNSLAGRLVCAGSPDVKIVMEDLLKGKSFHTVIDEQIVFDQLEYRASALWSLLLAGNLKEINIYMSKVALNTISYFDTGSRPSGKEPERFYHGFVLGLLVDLNDKYVISSNRKSGYGRYDVMLETREHQSPAIILEFKARDPEDEKALQDTVKTALRQIEEKQYTQILLKKVSQQKIFINNGFAFEGKNVLIGQ